MNFPPTDQRDIRNGYANIYTIYLVLCLILLATSPAILLGDGNRNLALIAFMFISPLFLRLRGFNFDLLLLLGFAFSIIIFPALIHRLETRWSTVLYSLMFCILFLSYHSLLWRGHLRIAVFLKVVRYLIIAYALTLFIQQLCVLFGLPILNVSNYDPGEPWKLNSLSAEPSHSARILGVLMLVYVVGKNIISRSDDVFAIRNKSDRVIWLCFLWSMLTMGSATAVIMIAIVLLSFFNRLSFKNYIVALLLLMFAIAIIPANLLGRVIDLSTAVLLIDYSAVLDADHSGGMRIAPMLVLTSYVELFSAKGLFGHGVDSVSSFLSNYIWGVDEGATGGGLLALWYEYGFIAFLFFVAFTMRATLALKSPANFIVWFLLIFLAGVNNQMVWLAIILFYTLRFYSIGHKFANKIGSKTIYVERSVRS